MVEATGESRTGVVRNHRALAVGSRRKAKRISRVNDAARAEEPEPGAPKHDYH